jgi:hypothetical protein
MRSTLPAFILSPALLGFFCKSELGSRWLAEVAPAITPSTAFTLCFLSMFALMALWLHLVQGKQVDSLADIAPATVALSPEECGRNMARTIFSGHPKVWAVLGTALLILVVWLSAHDNAPDKYIGALFLLPCAWVVLRAWRLIFSAARI